MVADGLTITAGEMVAVTGESGSGKTMLLEALGLLRRPDPGSHYGIVRVDGTVALAAAWDGPDAQAKLARLRRELFGFVPQSGGLLPFFDVTRNIALAQQLSGRSDRAYLTHLLQILGLFKLRHAMPDGLSIGERQRVAIARALAHRPLAVIADEPTAALDPYLSQEVMALFLSLAADQGTAVIVSTHNVDLVHNLGLRQLQMIPEVLAPIGDDRTTTIVSTLRVS
ncbi:ABC transporter ATP-binding protein [Frigidibacter mobilis]